MPSEGTQFTAVCGYFNLLKALAEARMGTLKLFKNQ
jgi:hypothetical protein